MSNKDQVAVIEHVLHEVRPLIMGHNGDIQLVKVEDDVVYVRLIGACINCPSSFFTLKFGIHEAVKKKVPTIKDVVAVE